MSRIFIKTFGCSLNTSDSEVMAGLLKPLFTLVHDEDSADLVIVNTCVVKEKTIGHLMAYLEDQKSKGKKIIVSGCAPQSMPERVSEFSIIGTSQIGNIVMVVEETLSGNTVALVAEEKNKRLLLPKIRKSPIIGIIPISKGCLGSCAFCLTKKARGTLESYSARDIVREVELAVKDGCKEIWLTSQDTACWGMDIKSSLPVLLRAILEVEGDFKVRLGMGNPEWFGRFVPELIEIFKDKKMFRFLHIPVQSGDDEVLKAMRRPYTVKEFKDITIALRKAHPDITLSTDMIVAFPGETNEQFNASMRLIEDLQFDVVNISRFSAHEGVAAASFEGQVHSNDAKERSVFLRQRADYAGFERNKKWLNWVGESIVEEEGHLKGTWITRNYCYKPIAVEGKFRLGDKIKVRVDNLTSLALRGKISF